MSPVVFGKRKVRRELFSLDKKSVCFSVVSGVFLAIHFVLWFESLKHTTVASSTTIVCTEVIWVALGFCVCGWCHDTWRYDILFKNRNESVGLLKMVAYDCASPIISWKSKGEYGRINEY